jgi:NTE family protein
MSIPYFFQPFRLKSLPRGPSITRWWESLGYDPKVEKGGAPKSAMFVDGGVMSNFPINAFHQSGIPTAPTFGIKLQYDNRRREIEGPIELLFGIFNSARHTLDYEFISENADYKHLVQWIPAQDYNWLDFNMSDKDKAGLFREGALAAFEFLNRFDWEGYKKMRSQMA